jgi:hypothetical protein
MENFYDVLRERGTYRTAGGTDPTVLDQFAERLKAAHKRDLAKTREHYVCSKHNALRVWVGPEEGQRQFVCSFCGKPE